MARRYNVREWLNGPESSFTGSVVAFHGEVERWDGKFHEVTHLEVADCAGKVSLHKGRSEEMSKLVAKLRKLAKVASEFADFLESK